MAGNLAEPPSLLEQSNGHPPTDFRLLSGASGLIETLNWPKVGVPLARSKVKGWYSTPS